MNYLAGNGFPIADRSGPGRSRREFLLRRNQRRQHDDAAHRCRVIWPARSTADNVDFVLSAWLGGYAAQNDKATVIARFLDSRTRKLARPNLPPSRQSIAATSPSYCFASSSAICRR